MAFRTLSVDPKGNVAIIRLVRPKNGYPFDASALQELDDACAAINEDPTTRVVLLTGEGDDSWKGWGLANEALASRPAFASLEGMGQPAICAINGNAFGTGLELALACDVRIANDTARFQTQAPAPAQRLARAVGRSQALRLLLLGEAIDALEALRIGLVSAVYPAERLADEAEALAAKIASRGPIALRYAKEAVRRGLELPLDEALRMETDLTVILQTTHDRAEGVRAFIEKREPDFKGR